MVSSTGLHALTTGLAAVARIRAGNQNESSFVTLLFNVTHEITVT